jgi:transposase
VTPRFKVVDYSPRFLPVDLSRQLFPGTFEFALHYLLEQELDLSEIESRYRNHEAGASAYEPRILLKIVLLAYARGILSSRGMEAACRDNVQFIALTGDAQPDHSTLARFVSELGDAAGEVFTQVLLICDRQGLIGREMFAIDGVKLPSNASKAKSGKRKDFVRQANKMHRAVEQLLGRHRDNDAAGDDAERRRREQRQIARLRRDACELEQWLEQHPNERKSAKGKPRLSNRTDNDSAKMPTGKGVLQGYTGVAAVDEKHQVVVHAQAYGSGSEQEVLPGLLDRLEQLRAPDTILAADSGYYSEANLKQLEARGIEGYIPDNGYRKRDTRYEGQEQHRAKPDALWDKSEKDKAKAKLFGPGDFQVAQGFTHLTCPAGKRLYRNGANCNKQGLRAIQFSAAQRDCEKCPLRAQCLRHPQRSKRRQVAIFVGKHASAKEKASDRMKRRIDSERGREMITRRFATVEPVFGNVRANKKMDRFTLRGESKVDGQWKLYCMVQNIEKLAHNGYAR